MISCTKGPIADQLDVVQTVVTTPALIVAVVIRWVERFGGGLGKPVQPFFLLALGLDATAMGQISTIGTLCSLLPAPLYGWAQDRFGPYYTLLVASAGCGIGCLLFGFAPGFAVLAVATAFQGIGGGSLATMVNAHVALVTPPARRSLVLTGFITQCLTLHIAGQAAYVPWDLMLRTLGVSNRVLRFRLTLSVCTFFCFFGVLQLLRFGHHLGDTRKKPGYGTEATDTEAVELRTPSSEGQGKGASDEAELGSSDLSDDAATPKPSSGEPHWPSARQTVALGSCFPLVFLVACYEALLSLAWPLFIKTHFGWQEHQFGGIIFASSVAQAVATASFPLFDRTFGGTRNILFLALALAFGSLAAFTFQSATASSMAASTVLMIGSQAIIAALNPGLNALASTLAPQTVQAKLFSAMSIAAALGKIAAGMVGARLFQFSMGIDLPASGSQSVLYGGGTLPTLLLAPITAAAAAALYGTVHNIEPPSQDRLRHTVD